MGVQCEILIKPPTDGVYKPGRTVSGSVKYAVDAPFRYKHLFISLNGEGFCQFASLRPSVITQLCIGEHDFVRETKCLFPGTIHGPPWYHILPAGTYEEDFSFKLPLNIPMPYRDKICKLTYQVKCTFQKPTLFGHKEFSAPIDVFAYVKPEQPEGSIPFELEKTLNKTFSQKTHTINVKGILSNTFFKPGENADLSFKVTNNTDTDIHSIETKLVCYTIYKGNCGRTKENVTIIQENAVETPGVPANCVLSLTSVMKVPEHLFSIQNCNVIKKQYRVRVTMRLYMPYTNAYTEIPVVIGHKSDDNNENTEEVVNAVTENSESSATSFTLEKTLLKFFSSKVQTIKLKGEISKTILTPGETADLSFTVSNHTDTPIRSVETKLVCFTTMGHPEKNKPSEVVVIESAVETAGVPANGVANLSSIMPIPTHVHTRQFGLLLSIQYKVRVTVKLLFPYTNASAEFPVVIREKGREQEITIRNNNDKQENSSAKESRGDNSKIIPKPVDVEDNKNSKVTSMGSGNPSSNSLEVSLEVKEENENVPSS